MNNNKFASALDLMYNFEQTTYNLRPLLCLQKKELS